MVFVKKCFVVFLLLASASVSFGQNRYMVFFKDKAGSPHTTAQPNLYLSQKAIDRRIRQGVAITNLDIPVISSYIQGVKNTGASVFFRSRWMNGVLVQCDASLLPSIQALAYVDRVEFVAPGSRLMSGGRTKVSFRKKAHVGFESLSQLEMLGIPDMHHDGYRGEGITIAVFDAGFPGVNTASAFSQVRSAGRINETVSFDFVANSGNVYQYDQHGTMVFSVISASIPDTYTGGAFEANYQLYVTEDASSEHRVEEYNWLFAAERADSAGVDIITSSLGYYDFDSPSTDYTLAQMDGATAVVTRAAQMAADRGIIVVASAGNEGNVPSWKIITAPADALDVVAVANVNASGIRSPGSSIGPSSDGRIKPDLAALGTGVRVINSGGNLTSASGTSLAAPLITSLFAGLWQRFPDLSNKELIAAIKKTASTGSNPNNAIGYGIPNYKAVVNYLSADQQQRVFEVYPNPITDSVTVSPLDPDSIPECRLEVITSHGQIIANNLITFTWLNPTYKSSVSDLAPGTYFFRIWVGQKRYVFKVVKV